MLHPLLINHPPECAELSSGIVPRQQLKRATSTKLSLGLGPYCHRRMAVFVDYKRKRGHKPDTLAPFDATDPRVGLGTIVAPLGVSMQGGSTGAT